MALPEPREDLVVDGDLVATTHEDGRTGGTDLLALADVDERQGARVVDGRAQVGGQPGSTAGPG